MNDVGRNGCTRSLFCVRFHVFALWPLIRAVFTPGPSGCAPVYSSTVPQIHRETMPRQVPLRHSRHNQGNGPSLLRRCHYLGHKCTVVFPYEKIALNTLVNKENIFTFRTEIFTDTANLEYSEKKIVHHNVYLPVISLVTISENNLPYIAYRVKYYMCFIKEFRLNN